MKKRTMTTKRTSLSLILCNVLIVAMALFTTGCGDNTKENDTGNQTSQVQSVKEDTASEEATVLGEGATVFDFTVVDKEGEETFFEIHTDKEIVGEALQELDLIAGEDGQYGLYVKTVNGITADYDKDKMYWAFYVNGEYAQSGVDTTKITGGESYSFKVEKS